MEVGSDLALKRGQRILELYIGVKEKKERDEEKKMEKKALALIKENRMA